MAPVAPPTRDPPAPTTPTAATARPGFSIPKKKNLPPRPSIGRTANGIIGPPSPSNGRNSNASSLELLSRLQAILPAGLGQEELGPTVTSAIRAIGSPRSAARAGTCVDSCAAGDASPREGGHAARWTRDASGTASASVSAAAAAAGTHDDGVASSSRSSATLAGAPKPAWGSGSGNNGLDGWILPPSSSWAGSENQAAAAAAVASATDAASEVLGIAAPAADDAEAALQLGDGAAAAVASFAAATAAMGSARLAASAAGAAMQRVTASRDVGVAVATTAGDVGGALAAAAAAVEGGVGATGGSGGRVSDAGVLSAIAPLLEEMAARQRREWGLQVSSAGGEGKGSGVARVLRVPRGGGWSCGGGTDDGSVIG